MDGEAHWVRHTLDANGASIERATSLGLREAIERDAIGARTKTVLDGSDVIEHACDLVGRETARVLPGGGRIESRYNALGRLAQRRALGPTAYEPQGPGINRADSPGNETVAATYRYDASGELVESRDQRRGLTRYEYDPVAQLLAMVLRRWTDSTGKVHEYVGKSKPQEAYKRRQAAHNARARKNGCTAGQYQFTTLQSGISGEPALSRAEESWIRAGGGPGGKPGQIGRLENKMHGQASSNYTGGVPWP